MGKVTIDSTLTKTHLLTPLYRTGRIPSESFIGSILYGTGRVTSENDGILCEACRVPSENGGIQRIPDQNGRMKCKVFRIPSEIV